MKKSHWILCALLVVCLLIIPAIGSAQPKKVDRSAVTTVGSGVQKTIKQPSFYQRVLNFFWWPEKKVERAIDTRIPPISCVPGDVDGDGVDNCVDNCRNTANADQDDMDNDGKGDVCDDSDADGTMDANDGCPTDAGKVAPGICGCGVADVDGDNDGTMDCVDGCPTDAVKVAPGTCGCGVADVDGDNDGTMDCVDGCPSDPNKVAAGVCGCGQVDYDTDNDGIGDSCELAPEVGLRGVQKLDLGYQTACAVLQGGNIVCWGGNGLGQTGDGTTVDHAQPHYVVSETGTGLFSDAVEVAMSHKKSCALKSDGTVWCWGHNHSGQLGTGDLSIAHSLYPVQVLEAHIAPGSGAIMSSSSPLTDVIQISSGGGGFTCAMKSDGKVLCWGANHPVDTNYYSIGRGDCNPCSRAVPVLVNLGTAQTPDIQELVADSIDTGSGRACALKDGSVYCWGSGGGGFFLGNEQQPYAVKVLEPLQLQGEQFTSISVGAGACVILSDGRAKCWGPYMDGHLGVLMLGYTVDVNVNVYGHPYVSSPQYIFGINAIGQLPDISKIAMSYTHSCTIFGAAETAVCYGTQLLGALGNNLTSGTSNVPKYVIGIQSLPWLVGVKDISTFGYSSCAIVGNDRALYCWGNNICCVQGHIAHPVIVQEPLAITP